jgi:hypothetical protein
VEVALVTPGGAEVESLVRPEELDPFDGPHGFDADAVAAAWRFADLMGTIWRPLEGRIVVGLRTRPMIRRSSSRSDR